MKRIIICIVILSISALIYGFPPKGCGLCWDKLGRMNILQILTIKEINASGEYKIDLLKIKNVLETAGITNNISIELFLNNKHLINLGSYKPTIKNQRSVFYSMKTNKGFKLPASLKDSFKSAVFEGILVIKSQNGLNKVSMSIRLRVLR